MSCNPPTSPTTSSCFFRSVHLLRLLPTMEPLAFSLFASSITTHSFSSPLIPLIQKIERDLTSHALPSHRDGWKAHKWTIIVLLLHSTMCSNWRLIFLFLWETKGQRTSSPPACRETDKAPWTLVQIFPCLDVVSAVQIYPVVAPPFSGTCNDMPMSFIGCAFGASNSWFQGVVLLRHQPRSMS
jgi:hypothetical protein